MVLSKRPMSWSAVLRQRSIPTVRSSTGRQSWHKIQRRGYASESGHSSKSSDLPWAIGAVSVTVPSVYYLLQEDAKRKAERHSHGHGDEHAEHEESSEGGEESEDKGEATEQGEEIADDGKGDSGAVEESEESGNSESEGDNHQATPDTSDDEDDKSYAKKTDGESGVEGVQFKGATKEGAKGDTRKRYPDAKGGNKKRIESDYGIKQGELDEEEDGPGDTPASSKPPGSSDGSMSGKQEGISNTDTKHSTDMANNPDKSKKGEGTVDTAKLKGTVEPQRPQS